MSVTPIQSRRRSIGVYYAVTCRDASSLDNDGQAYVDLNMLETADGRPLCEIQFTDGHWKLADPMRDLVPGFVLDSVPDKVYLAHSYGDPWNGFATPVVDKATLIELLLDVEETHRWEGPRVWIDEDESAFEPRPDGRYDTAFLGWTFTQVRTS